MATLQYVADEIPPLAALALLFYVRESRGRALVAEPISSDSFSSAYASVTATLNITTTPSFNLPGCILLVGDGESLYGQRQIVRFLARALENSPGKGGGPTSLLSSPLVSPLRMAVNAPMPPPELQLNAVQYTQYHHLYGKGALEATQVDYFIDMAQLIAAEPSRLPVFCATINEHLATRTSLVGHQFTIADLVVYEAFFTSQRWRTFARSAEASGEQPHLFRWFAWIEKHAILRPALSIMQKVITERAKKRDEQSRQGNYNIDMKNREAGVVTRFPPEPSGYLHIGHAKAALLNAYYATEYNGKLILRFDDTNPSKEKDEYVDGIIADLKTLGIQHQQLTWTSDSFDLIIQYCEKLIKAGKAYVDDTPVEKMREERMNGIESAARNQSVDEAFRLFEEMKHGTELGLKCAVRARIDMRAANKCMRDPTIFRCKVDTPHHRTGTKYKVYPTYDFACPIVDAIEGVTHALRTIEYRDRNEQFQWFLDALGLRQVQVLDYARLNFVHTLMSKRKLQWLVDNHYVDGWDDPRFPTVRGILRRGMTVEAIREFMKLQGFSKSVTLMEWDKIWSINKRIIDPVAHRYTAINQADKVPVVLNGGPSSMEFVSVQLHPKNPSIGYKAVARDSTIYIEQDDAMQIKDNEEVTLMSWGNAIITKIEKTTTGKISKLEARLHLEGDFKKTEKKLTWIAGNICDFVPIKLVVYDHILTVPKLEDDQNLQDVINPNSKQITDALGEQALRVVQQGQIIQLNRKGFYYCDRSTQTPKGIELVLNWIPSQNYGVAAKWAEIEKTKAMATAKLAKTTKAKGSK